MNWVHNVLNLFLLGPTKQSKRVRIRPRDMYFQLIYISWTHFLFLLLTFILGVNVFFSFLFQHFGGIAGVNPDSFLDHFYFSIQTFTTIGYGQMHPISSMANFLVTTEVIVGLFCVSLFTGLMFAKFSQPKPKIIFSDVAVIGKRNGRDHLTFRIANERGNNVSSAKIQVSILTYEMTREGEKIRRFHDLKLVRDNSPLFMLTWFVMHEINNESPLKGLNFQKMKRNDIWIIVSFSGHDSILSQIIYDTKIYRYDKVMWSAQLEESLKTNSKGDLYVDFEKFHCFKKQE